MESSPWYSSFDFWINFFKILSIIAAGVFAALGLLTKYRDEQTNEITRWGKIALIGIIISGSMSFVLQTLEIAKTGKEAKDKEESARKADAEAQNTKRSLEEIFKTSKSMFDQQKIVLDDSNILKSNLEQSLQQTEDVAKKMKDSLQIQDKNLSQTRIVAQKMDNSLEAQKQVLSGNKEILTGVAEGAKRDSENTIGILRTIWNESNRVQASQITVSVNYQYQWWFKKAPPILLDKNWKLNLHAHQEGTLDARIKPDEWSLQPLLDKTQLFLIAKEQKIISQQTVVNDQETSYNQISIFSNFDGEMKNFSDMTKWNYATIEVVLTGQSPTLDKELRESVTGFEDSDLIKELKRLYYFPEYLQVSGFSITPLPVSATMVVSVRGRPIASSFAQLTLFKANEQDKRGLVVVKFRLVTIPKNTFPYFKPTLQN